MHKWDIPKTREKTGQVALIDGDVIVYRIGFSVQKDHYTVIYEGETYKFEGKRQLNDFLYREKLPPDSEDVKISHKVVVEPVQNAFHSIKILIEQILDATECDEYEIYLTGDNNFREGVAEYAEYKGNRVGRRPEYYDEIRKYLVEHQGGLIVNGMEADDALSIRQSKADNTCLCSIDKDLMMVPGKHYDWVKDEVKIVDEELASRNFWSQMISGDGTDNIYGIYGMGKKKADKALKECRDNNEMFHLVWDLYQEKIDGNPLERFIENIHLLWMLRSEEEIPI